MADGMGVRGIEMTAQQFGTLAATIADRSDDFLDWYDDEDSDGNRFTTARFDRAAFLSVFWDCARALSSAAIEKSAKQSGE